MNFRKLSAQKFFYSMLYRYWNVPALPEYAELMRHDSWSEEQLRALQEQKLTELLRYACANIPYYRRVMEKSGIRAEDIEHKDALSVFPILTKKLIQENSDSLVSPNMSAGEYSTEYSGGSTGQPPRSGDRLQLVRR
ncbi:MAG: phenylacetate--CoA ligase [Desulfobacteraceae bacterium]|nr:phenylacetate--CoA ligase [Desulfobacteraceae bacterium]